MDERITRVRNYCAIRTTIREVITGRVYNQAPPNLQPIGPLFKDYASQWLDACKARGLKASTRRSYRTIVDVHLIPAFGELHLTQVDRRAVKQFVYSKLSEPIVFKKKAGDTTKDRSPRTVLRILCGLSALFNVVVGSERP